MLAVTGYIFQAACRLPGTIDLDGTTFDAIPNGVGAIGAIPSLVISLVHNFCLRCR